MAEVGIFITHRSRLRVAPEAVFFRASVRSSDIPPEADGLDRYDESFHRLLYDWSFGDPGAISSKVVNLPKVHNDLNRAYGKAVTHVFTRAGRYEVTCVVHTLEGDRVGENRIVVEVTDPSRLFAETATILIDAEENGDPNDYPGAQIAPNLPTALQALEDLNAPGRILLPRGTRHVLDTQLSISRRYPHFHLGAWGRGDRPILAAHDTGEYRRRRSN